MGEEVDGAYDGTVFAGMDAGMARCPQETYRLMRAAAPVLRAGAGVVVSTRAEVDEVLRHPEVYSSRMPEGRLGNIRPLIPIEIDPPDQKKYRKIR